MPVSPSAGAVSGRSTKARDGDRAAAADSCPEDDVWIAASTSGGASSDDVPGESSTAARRDDDDDANSRVDPRDRIAPRARPSRWAAVHAARIAEALAVAAVRLPIGARER